MEAKTTTSPFEEFGQLVTKYKHVIESNATARCMIGFTAASLIRSEGKVDIKYVEQWLQSMEVANRSQHGLDKEEQDALQIRNNVETILNVVKHTATTYWSHNYHEAKELDADDEESSTDDSEKDEDESDFEFFAAEDEGAYQLNRFISHDPYLSNSITCPHPKYNLFLENYQSIGQSSYLL